MTVALLIIGWFACFLLGFSLGLNSTIIHNDPL